MSSHFLPPGPWDVRGNKIVTSSGQTIATVFFPRYASEIARMISQVPELSGRVEELEDTIEELKLQLESARLGAEDEEKDYD